MHKPVEIVGYSPSPAIAASRSTRRRSFFPVVAGGVTLALAAAVGGVALAQRSSSEPVVAAPEKPKHPFDTWKVHKLIVPDGGGLIDKANAVYKERYGLQVQQQGRPEDIEAKIYKASALKNLIGVQKNLEVVIPSNDPNIQTDGVLIGGIVPRLDWTLAEIDSKQPRFWLKPRVGDMILYEDGEVKNLNGTWYRFTILRDYSDVKNLNGTQVYGSRLSVERVEPLQVASR